MNKPTKPTPPAISSTDAQGVVWTFDPAADKWVALVDKKKMSSGNFETLREKVHTQQHTQALKAKGVEPPAPVQVSKPIEATLIEVEVGSHWGGGEIAPTQVSPKFIPTQVKLDWDAKKGVHVVRYKGAKDDGWQSRNADTKIWIHPEFATPEMWGVVERFILGRGLLNEHADAERAIAQAWWGSKEEKVEFWTLGRDDVPQSQGARFVSSSREGIGCSAMPIVLPPALDAISFKEWAQNDDGSLSRGDLTVRMDVDKKYGSVHNGLQFALFTKDREDPIYLSKDLEQVLHLGNATHQMQQDDSQPQTFWMATKDWENDKNHRSVSFPKPYEARTLALLRENEERRFQANAQVYYFGDLNEDLLSSVGMATPKKSSSGYSYEMQGAAWRKMDRSYGGTTLRMAGPEDEALKQVVALGEAFEQARKKMKLSAMEKTTLLEVFASTLSDTYNAGLEGEELPTMDAVKLAFERHITRLTTRAADNAHLLEFKTQAQKAVEKAQESLEGTADAPPPKAGRKPR